MRLNSVAPALVLLAAATAVAAADESSGSPASNDQTPRVVIGSKGFTESVILGEMLDQLAEHAGADTLHRAELGGTQFLWKGLLGGEIDAYVEYTGTIHEELLAGLPIRSRDDMAAALARQGVVMTPSIGFSNTYALGMQRARAEELGITSISDLRDHPELKFALSDEFMAREDGWPGLVEEYRLPQKSVRGMDHGLSYRGLQGGSADVVDLFATDPEIRLHDLLVLDDDLGYFPPYDAVILYRTDLDETVPAVVAALRRLEGKIDATMMAEMNARAVIDRTPESVIAGEFLHEFVDPSIAPPVADDGSGFRRDLARFLRNTREHLVMVLVSLTAAMLVAIPLGILAYRRPRLGRFILGATGVVQTLPSLAVLVFMIPLLGLGMWPAIVALFLYSLLPIVRNTYTGLMDIPESIHESAAALGLLPWPRLWRIELPLAARSILGGIKTAAVINVGTATIGALIGAGGYGQPILTGIRLTDYGLILQGAIPAAILAILVQSLFGLLERPLALDG